MALLRSLCLTTSLLPERFVSICTSLAVVSRGEISDHFDLQSVDVSRTDSLLTTLMAYTLNTGVLTTWVIDHPYRLDSDKLDTVSLKRLVLSPTLQCPTTSSLWQVSGEVIRSQFRLIAFQYISLWASVSTTQPFNLTDYHYASVCQFPPCIVIPCFSY